MRDKDEFILGVIVGGGTIILIELAILLIYGLIGAIISLFT